MQVRVQVKLVAHSVRAATLPQGSGPVLCEVIEEPIKRSALLVGEPIKLTGKRALRKALVRGLDLALISPCTRFARARIPALAGFGATASAATAILGEASVGIRHDGPGQDITGCSCQGSGPRTAGKCQELVDAYVFSRGIGWSAYLFGGATPALSRVTVTTFDAYVNAGRVLRIW